MVWGYPLSESEPAGSLGEKTSDYDRCLSHTTFPTVSLKEKL